MLRGHRASSQFQSTLSVRRATIVKITEGGGYVFQSTLSVRRATSWRFWRRVHCGISIHALREESDTRP